MWVRCRRKQAAALSWVRALAHNNTVNQQISLEASEERPRWSGPAFWGTGATLVFLAYAIVLLVTGRGGIVDAAFSSMRNLVPLAILTAVVRPLLVNHVQPIRPLPQLGAHLALAAAFSMLWYWLLMILIAVSAGTFTQFTVDRFFPTPAVAWQLLQGMFVYALLAAVIFLRAAPASPIMIVTGPVSDPVPELGLTRFFVRRGDEIHPLSTNEIVSIVGADDYAEVTTSNERHLVRMTLAEMERTLDTQRFIRVHRSRIVNVERIERAEPAGGGRMLLHMENGEMIQASRTGARLLRDRTF